VPSTTEGAAQLLTAAAVRERCHIVRAAAERGETAHFRLVPARVDEAETAQAWSRSEGLVVASLRAMQSGLFSADPADPWRADAKPLWRLSTEGLARAFQHSYGNELLGIEARAALLRRLGEVCTASPALFCAPARHYWSARGGEISAPEILHTLLEVLGPIWPGRLSLAGVPLGDCGRHSAVPGNGLVPFHKLSQWLAYSLIEPLEAAGLRVTDIDGLTGLAEYRNGGLFIDCGVIEPRDPSLLLRPLDPQSEPVVEWRALTVALLDRLALRVRERLGKSPQEFPLVCVLEGGSWAAGREIALEHRPDSRAPLTDHQRRRPVLILAVFAVLPRNLQRAHRVRRGNPGLSTARRAGKQRNAADFRCFPLFL
jgi:hypothetical protein